MVVEQTGCSAGVLVSTCKNQGVLVNIGQILKLMVKVVK